MRALVLEVSVQALTDIEAGCLSVMVVELMTVTTRVGVWISLRSRGRCELVRNRLGGTLVHSSP